MARQSYSAPAAAVLLLTLLVVTGAWLLDPSAVARAGERIRDLPANNNLQIAQQLASTDVIKLGRKTSFRKGCASCHSFNGKRMAGPTWKGLYNSNRRFTDGKEAVADEAYIRRAILKPRDEVVASFPANLMPLNLGEKLSDNQLDAIIQFIKSLK